VARLIDTARSVPVGHRSLADYLFFTPRALREQIVVKAARRAAQEGLPTYAYVMGYVSSHNVESGESQVLYKGVTATLKHAGRIASYGLASPTEPRVGIFQVDDDGLAIAGYLHPVCSEHYWCPVDSNNEREFIDAMLEAAFSLRATHKVIVKKPLFAFDDTGYLADLLVDTTHLVTRETTRIVCEVLGYDDDAYRARKAEQTAVLAKRYRVLNYDATKLSATNFNATGVLKQLLRR
jgi:hypothetical protein